MFSEPGIRPNSPQEESQKAAKTLPGACPNGSPANASGQPGIRPNAMRRPICG